MEKSRKLIWHDKWVMKEEARKMPCENQIGLPTNCGASFTTLPESLTSFTVHLRAHPSAFHSHFLSAHNTGTVFLNFFL